MRKNTKRMGSRGGKTENVAVIEKPWKPVKIKVTQADVDRAFQRSEVEQQATNIARLQSLVSDLRNEQVHLESRLQQTRTEIATTMLQHVEATQKFKDMTALHTQVP